VASFEANRASVADLASWSFTQDGLELTLDGVPPDLVITYLPWQAIEPLMKPGAPLNPSSLRALP
jgi:hypothetical protein